MFLGVTGMLLPMPYTEEERQQLASIVRTARLAAQLDKEPAARAAEVNSITWKRVEDAEGVRDASLGKILSSLGLPTADELISEANHPEPQLGAPRPQAPRADWPAVGSLAELPGYPSSFDHLFIEWSRNRDNMIHAEMQYALMRGINPLAARGELEEAARAYDAFNTGDGWNPPWFAAPKKHDLIGAQPSEEQSTEGGQDGLESASQSDAPPEGNKDKKIGEQLANNGESDPLTGLDRWRGDAGEVEDGDDSADKTG